jgi:hypothetical protein
VSKAEEYRLIAAECLRTAELAADPAAKASMLAMASVWQNLADQADRKRESGDNGLMGSP